MGRRGPKRLEHGRCALRKCGRAGIIEHRSARLEDRCRLLSKKEMSGRPLAEVPKLGSVSFMMKREVERIGGHLNNPEVLNIVVMSYLEVDP